MKPIYLALSPFFVLAGLSVVHAQPNFSETGPALNMTAFTDDQDPNLYYLAPTVMAVSHDDSGVPEFSYLEENGFLSRKALVQTTMEPFYDQGDVATAQKSILAVNPNAHFASLPFMSSSVIFDSQLSPYVTTNDCNHSAGLVGQEETCSFELSAQGENVMKSSFRTGLTLTIQFQYSVEGVIEKPDHTFVQQTNVYGVAGLLGGAELAKFPQLFRGSNGKEIPLK